MSNSKVVIGANNRILLTDKADGCMVRSSTSNSNYREIEKARMIDVDVIDAPRKAKIGVREISLLCISVGFLILCLNYTMKTLVSMPAISSAETSLELEQKITGDSEITSIENVDAILKVANQRVSEEDYRGAIDIIQTALDSGSTDVALKNKIDELKAKYKGYLVNKARSVADEEGNFRGSEILRSGMDMFKDDPEYVALSESYANRIPDNLFELDPYSVNDVASVGGGYYYTDNYGNTYERESVIYNKNNWFADEKTGVASYVLPEGKYDILTGTVYVPYEARDTEEAVYGEALSIYGDGHLIWKGKPIHGTDEPYNLPEINITGVKMLEFRIKGFAYKGDGSPSYPTMCLGNLQVSKS